MKGKHRIIVQNKRLRYDFEIQRNLTIIRGDSATGKTTLVEMVREYTDNGDESSIELISDKKGESEIQPDAVKTEDSNCSNWSNRGIPL